MGGLYVIEFAVEFVLPERICCVAELPVEHAAVAVAVVPAVAGLRQGEHCAELRGGFESCGHGEPRSDAGIEKPRHRGVVVAGFGRTNGAVQILQH